MGLENQVTDQVIKKKSCSFRKAILIISICVLLAFIGVFMGGVYVYIQLQPVDSTNNEQIKVDIPLGASVLKIAELLKEHGVIRNQKVFYYYTRFKRESGLQAGSYYFSGDLSANQILLQLKEGKVSAESTIFTIPEGLTIKQVAKRIADNGLVDESVFLDTVNNGDFSEFFIVSEIPDSEIREYRLEGFLFPETYEIPKGSSEEEIISIMLNQLERELKEEWREDIKHSGLSLYEIMTLASIIERESISPKERKLISGVFYNRLEKGMLLQADATIQFALGEQKERLLYSDLSLDNPYNTYIYPRLPPSPIAVPGRSSIEAAIYPEKTEYLFYVTKKDGSGEHYFSKTYDEHKQYIEKSKRNMNQ